MTDAVQPSSDERNAQAGAIARAAAEALVTESTSLIQYLSLIHI